MIIFRVENFQTGDMYKVGLKEDEMRYVCTSSILSDTHDFSFMYLFNFNNAFI